MQFNVLTGQPEYTDYTERHLIEPRLTGARLSALVQAALVYTVLVHTELHRGGHRGMTLIDWEEGREGYLYLYCHLPRTN